MPALRLDPQHAVFDLVGCGTFNDVDQTERQQEQRRDHGQDRA